MKRSTALWCTTVALAWSTIAFGLGKPEHSKVKVSSQTVEKKLRFDFKVEPEKGMKVTLDAPWKLEIVEHKGLNFPKNEFKQDELNKKMPGWQVTTTNAPEAKTGEVEYKLTAFICTENKTRCYREVHKGKTEWTLTP